jgi:exopolysaccharide biosynthesis operon protein EpsL
MGTVRKCHRRSRQRAARITCVVCVVSGGVLLSAGKVSAETGGFVPYVSVAVTHDDNLFRLSGDADTAAILGTDRRADTYRVVEAGADLGAQISRQRLSLHGDLMQTRFSRFGFLDNDGGSARARWDWSVLSGANGRLGYDYRRSLASLETQSAGRNIRGDGNAYGEADLRIAHRLRLRLGASERNVQNSLDAQRILDVRATTVESALHLLSVPPQGVEAEPNYLGLRIRSTRGDYPTAQIVDTTTVDNSYEEREAGAVAGWRFADNSLLEAFAGHTERDYHQLPARDFAGTTGRLDYNWQVSGKTSVIALLWRELTVADDQSAAYVLSQGLLLGPDWSVTRKTTFKARAGIETRDYRGDPSLALGTAAERKDRIGSYSVGLDYKPAQAINLALAWKTASRESNRALTDYRYRSVTATLRAHF